MLRNIEECNKKKEIIERKIKLYLKLIQREKNNYINKWYILYSDHNQTNKF